MKLLLSLAALALAVSAASALPERSPKYMSLFNLVKFKNRMCTSSQDDYMGTCYSEEECSDKGGSTNGNCAQGKKHDPRENSPHVFAEISLIDSWRDLICRLRCVLYLHEG